VPLSEHEQRLLEQMERALYAEDPKFASSLRGADLRRHYRRRALVAAVAFLAGVALLFVGVATKWPVTVVGFVIMLGAGLLAVTSWRHVPNQAELHAVPSATPSGRPRAKAGRTPRTRRGFMTRIEERWNHRREQRDR
jgi:hypothetical protein